MTEVRVSSVILAYLNAGVQMMDGCNQQRYSARLLSGHMCADSAVTLTPAALVKSELLVPRRLKWSMDAVSHISCSFTRRVCPQPSSLQCRHVDNVFFLYTLVFSSSRQNIFILKRALRQKSEISEGLQGQDKSMTFLQNGFYFMQDC